MAIINSYPLATPKLTDLVLGTSTSSTGQTSTKSFTIQSIKDTTAAVKTIVTATPDTLAITGTTNVTINTITAAVTNGGNSLATGNDIYDFVVGKITGTANTVPIWTDTTTLGDSLISQANNSVIINGSGTDGRIQLNCSNGNHGVGIQSPPHSAGATYDWILPQSAGTAGQVLTSGGGATDQLTWSTNGNVGGTGTANKLSKWTNANTLADSNVEDTGSLVTISSAAKVTGNLELDADLLDVNGGTGTAGQLLSSLGTGNGIDWVDAPVTGVVTVTSADTDVITVGGTSTNPTIDANTGTVSSSSDNLATGKEIQAAIDLTVLTVATGNSDTITIGGTATNPTVAANTASGVGANLDNLATGGQIQAAIDAALAGAVTFKGTFNASTGAITGGGNLTSGGSRVAVAVGDMYVVSVGGNFYGNSSTPLNVGDEVIAVSAAVAGASVEGDWNAVPSAGGGITGGGTTNKVPLWTGTTVLGDSAIAQSGTNIGIGTTSPAEKLTVSGNVNFTGKLAVGLSAAHSSIAFYNQNDAYFNGAVTIDDTFTQSGGGASTFSGNVGIGTTSPDAKLDIQGDGADFFLQSADFKLARIQPRGTGANLDKGLFSLFNGSTESFRLDTEGNSWLNGGNVSIGHTSPTAPLDVRRSDASGRVAEFHNNGGYGINIDVEADGGVNTIGSATNQALAFVTNGGSNEKMRIASDGNVGIGEDNPNSDLHITDSFPRITLQDSDGTNQMGFLDFSNGQLGINSRDGTSYGEIRFYRFNGTATEESMRISSSGQVKFNNYTAPGSFTGTAAANLAVDSSGNIITEAASGGGGGGTKTVSTVASVAAGVSTHALGVTVTTTPLVNYVDLYISGVYQSKTSYTVSGSTLTLTGATFPTGALIETVTTT